MRLPVFSSMNCLISLRGTCVDETIETDKVPMTVETRCIMPIKCRSRCIVIILRTRFGDLFLEMKPTEGSYAITE